MIKQERSEEDLHLKASLAETQNFKINFKLEVAEKKVELKNDENIAIIMLLDNEAIEKIVKYTGLTIDEVNKIIKSNED